MSTTAVQNPTRGMCGNCQHLGPALPSGVRYCSRLGMWRWAWERPDCNRFEQKARA